MTATSGTADADIDVTGFHSVYLGSDREFHYFKLGNVVGNTVYCIKIADLHMKKTYEYDSGDPVETKAVIRKK